MKAIFLFIGYVLSTAIIATGLLSVLNGLFGWRLGYEGTEAPADAQAGTILVSLGVSLALACLPFSNAWLANQLRQKPIAIIGYVILLGLLPAVPIAIFVRADTPYRTASEALFNAQPEVFTKELLAQLDESTRHHLFSESIRHDNAEIAKRLAASLSDTSGKRGEAYSGTVLHKGNPSILQLLVDRNADFSFRDAAGGGPLHQLLNGDASEERQLACLTILQQHRLANVHDRDNFGRTPLMVAAERGHALLVKRLLDLGAKPSDSDQFGNTALHLACDKSYVYPDFNLAARPKIVTLLRRAGADPKRKNALGETCASLAQKAELQQILRSLETK